MCTIGVPQFQLMQPLAALMASSGSNQRTPIPMLLLELLLAGPSRTSHLLILETTPCKWNQAHTMVLSLLASFRVWLPPLQWFNLSPKAALVHDRLHIVCIICRCMHDLSLQKSDVRPFARLRMLFFTCASKPQM